jgi:phage shock protein A
MTTIKSLQEDIDDLFEQSDKATAESERLAALAINYDANGVPNKAELDRGLAAKRLMEAKAYKSNAETKQKEQQKMIDQVEQIDREIARLKNERDKLTG